MEYSKILEYLGPCGINCQKCFAFKDGDIHKNSDALKTNLGNFDVYASRFVDLLNEQTFAKYPEFKEVLNLLSTTNCFGCRKQECHLFKSCYVRTCYKEKSVDFCFQCDEFPCSKTGFDQHLEQRWKNINLKMKAIGVEKYYEEIKDKPRY